MSILVWVAVLLCGGAGSVLRFLVDRSVADRFARSFPLGTLTVNVSGAAVLGVISGIALHGHAALLAGTATVGSYTTFSTWLLETRLLAEERQWRLAATNIVASVILGLSAALVGQAAVERI